MRGGFGTRQNALKSALNRALLNHRTRSVVSCQLMRGGFGTARRPRQNALKGALNHALSTTARGQLSVVFVFHPRFPNGTTSPGESGRLAR